MHNLNFLEYQEGTTTTTSSETERGKNAGKMETVYTCVKGMK